jgi:hypothetical protein
MSNTCIAKTITSSFIQAEKIPMALGAKGAFRNSSNCFFVKNRKMNNLRNPSRDEAIRRSLPDGFRGILKAKSTMIKHDKLKEFYISHEENDDFIRKADLSR